MITENGIISKNTKQSFGNKFRKNFETAYKMHNISRETRKKDKNMHKIKLDGKIKI